MSTNFGEQVKQGRMHLGKSQAEFADELNISRNYLSQIERGLATNLSWQLRETIAEKLGLLLNGDDDELPPGLKEFAEESEIPDGDVRMLSNIEYRGKRPQTPEQWNSLYRVIKGLLSE